MPRYKQVWPEFPPEQYNSLPAATRQLIDLRIEELLEDPTGDPHARYYRPHDEWSIPLAFGARRMTPGGSDDGGYPALEERTVRRQLI